MGRLAGFSYRQIIKILKTFGFVFHQAAGNHEICSYTAPLRSIAKPYT